MQVLGEPTPLGKFLTKPKIICLLKRAFSNLDQHCFSKVLVARSFEFAKTLVAEVVEFYRWHAMVKTPSRLDPRVIGNAMMSPCRAPDVRDTRLGKT